jgi:acetyl-CoA carboxylase biotin carboxyl carrier protein
VSARRSTRSQKKARPIILPNSFGGPAPEALLTSGQTKQIQELIDLLRRNNLTELELERQGVRIRVRHEVGVKTVTASVHESVPSAPQQTAQPAAATGPSPEETAGMVTITSPIVGTFYRSPSPDADPYVEEGDFVRKGQVLCIVEAMKLMNEIESEVDGRIVKIMAESTKSVEYGQALFLIDPKATS